MLIAIAMLFCIFGPIPVGAQSVKDGIDIFRDAEDLYLHAKSNADLQEAARKFKEAMEIFRRRDYKQGIAGAAINLALIHRRWGKYSRAVRYAETALSASRDIPHPKGEARALNNLAQIYSDLGRDDKALQYAKESLEIRKRIKDKEGVAFSLHSLGYVYFNLADYPKAEESMLKAYDIYKELGDVSRQGLVLNDLGDSYRKLGRYQDALRDLHRALGLFKKTRQPKFEAAALANIGGVYERVGMFKKAVEYQEKALRSTEQIAEPLAEGEIHINIGNIHVQSGKYEEALEHFQKCLAIYQKIRVKTEWPTDLIGNTYMDMGDLPKAEPYVRRAGKDSSLGRYYLLESDYSKAREHYEKLRVTSKRNKDARDLFIAYTGLGTVNEALGRYEAAAGFFEKAVEASEDIRESLTEEQKANFFEVNIGGFPRTAPYEGHARVLQKLNRHEESFQQSESTKARLFAEKLSQRPGEAGAGVPEAVKKRDLQLNNRLAGLLQKQEKAYEDRNDEILSEVGPQIRETERELAAHIQTLRNQYPRFAATKYPEPMKLSQTALKDNEWVLAYDVSDSGLLVYLSKGREIVKGLFKSIPRKELEELVVKSRAPLVLKPDDKGFRRFVAKLKSFDFPSSSKLSDLLLGGMLEEIGDQAHAHVIVVPDECLGLVPFEALVLDSGGTVSVVKKLKDDKAQLQVSMPGTKLFGDRYQVSYYQSVTALTLARNHGKSERGEDRLLVVANPVFHMKDPRAQTAKKMPKQMGPQRGGRYNPMIPSERSKTGGLVFPDLPLTGNLAKNLRTMYGPSTRVLTGLNANKGNFLANIAPGLARYGKVVFATHGYFGDKIPEPVLILTLVPPGADGLLCMSEVMGFDMNADVVALTACQTGIGKHVSGEGTMAMGRAFQYAGSRSVLMTLWSVYVKASVDLVESFFLNMKRGKNKLEALALARKKIRDDGMDHPIFWAGFILVGEVD